MSYNMVLAFLPDTVPSMIGASSAASVSFDEASSMMGSPSAAAVGPHTLLVDPTMQMLAVPPFTPVPGMATVALSGVSDTYMIKIDGDSPRLRVISAHGIEEDEGVPLPAEGIFDETEDLEDAHLDFFCRIAGIGSDDLWNLSWTPLAP